MPNPVSSTNFSPLPPAPFPLFVFALIFVFIFVIVLSSNDDCRICFEPRHILSSHTIFSLPLPVGDLTARFIDLLPPPSFHSLLALPCFSRSSPVGLSVADRLVLAPLSLAELLSHPPSSSPRILLLRASTTPRREQLPAIPSAPQSLKSFAPPRVILSALFSFLTPLVLSCLLSPLLLSFPSLCCLLFPSPSLLSTCGNLHRCRASSTKPVREARSIARHEERRGEAGESDSCWRNREIQRSRARHNLSPTRRCAWGRRGGSKTWREQPLGRGGARERSTTTRDASKQVEQKGKEKGRGIRGVCVCVCVCACARALVCVKERETEGRRNDEGGREEKRGRRKKGREEERRKSGGQRKRRVSEECKGYGAEIEKERSTNKRN
eukprot:760892-Hanusia_phi.AAC.2